MSDITETMRVHADMEVWKEFSIKGARQLLRDGADEIERLQRANEHLLECLRGISRQTAEMVRANE